RRGQRERRPTHCSRQRLGPRDLAGQAVPAGRSRVSPRDSRTSHTRNRKMAQVDYFLKLKGIDGESTDATHKGQIDIKSWSIGVTNRGSHETGGGGGTGKASFQDIHFVAPMSKASPK